MILEKTTLQPSFTRISGVSTGKILKFKRISAESDELALVPVDPLYEGMRAQLKISYPSGLQINLDNLTITCGNASIDSLISTPYIYNNTIYINVPKLEETYTVSISVSNITYSTSVSVTQCQQYVAILSSESR